MKAAVIHGFGAPDVLTVEDVLKPEPGPDDVLIKVLAIGLNRIDHYVREGWINPDIQFPHVLGSDISGEIESVGENVKEFKKVTELSRYRGIQWRAMRCLPVLLLLRQAMLLGELSIGGLMQSTWLFRLGGFYTIVQV